MEVDKERDGGERDGGSGEPMRRITFLIVDIRMGRYEAYLIQGETLIPWGGMGRGERFALVLDMPHI